MKLNQKAVANSLAVLGAGYYLICSLLVFLAPNFYKSIATSWMHGVDVSRVWQETPPDMSTIVLGFITFLLISWVSGYVFAYIYNYFSKDE